MRTGAAKEAKGAIASSPIRLLFSPDGKTVVSTNVDGTVTLWNVGAATLSEKTKADIKAADLVVLFVGTTKANGDEGNDRDNIAMPGNYDSLIDQTAALGNDKLALVIQSDGPVKIDGFKLLEQEGRRALVEVTLHEGRKHIVRRLLKEAGFPVRSLARTGFGPINLGRLKPGSSRSLTEKEVADLYKVVGL